MFRTARFFLTLSILLLVAGMTIEAGSKVKSARKAIQRGRYAAALEKLWPLAKEGDAEAQYLVGTLYGIGRGLPRDDARRAVWIGKAAESGYVEAQFALAELLAAEEPAADNAAKAIEWYERAAEAGHLEAQRTLASAYVEGELVPVDAAAALKWHRACAEQDDADCIFRVGQAYAEGAGVERDDRAAVEWFRRAEARDNPSGRLTLARMMLEGRGVERDARAAIELLDRGVKADHADSRNYLARLYLDGKHVARDPVRAFDVASSMELRIEAADAMSEEELADAGKTVARECLDGNYASAATRARILAHRGVKSAQYDLGRMTALAYGTSQDLAGALMWLELSEGYVTPGRKELIHGLRKALGPERVDVVMQHVSRFEPTSWRPETDDSHSP